MMFSSIKDLKKWYFIFFEIGMILALLIFLSAFSIEMEDRQSYKPAKEDIGIPILVDIPTTEQQVPAPPPNPHIPASKPGDVIFNESNIDIPNNDVYLGDALPVVKNRNNDDEDVIFVPFEKGPKLIGGLESLYKQIEYPRKARLAGIEGTVIVQFIVNRQGKVTGAEVIRGIGGGCDNEALRVVKKMKFEPARQRERYVPVKMNIPIKFQLKN